MTTKKVLQFPSWVKKDLISEDWDRIEKNFREQTAAKGYPEEKIDAVCRRLKIHHSELFPLTEFKMSFSLPADLSEEQLIAVQDLIRQVEIKGREQMGILITGALDAIKRLEWAWEIYRESDFP